MSIRLIFHRKQCTAVLHVPNSGVQQGAVPSWKLRWVNKQQTMLNQERVQPWILLERGQHHCTRHLHSMPIRRIFQHKQCHGMQFVQDFDVQHAAVQSWKLRRVHNQRTMRRVRKRNLCRRAVSQWHLRCRRQRFYVQRMRKHAVLWRAAPVQSRQLRRTNNPNCKRIHVRHARTLPARHAIHPKRHHAQDMPTLS